jgi:succinate dehydrogenase / fumarate reductase cytochrome b subunit
MVVLSFRDQRLAIAYMAAVLFLCLHLSHGFSSLFQTLGLNNEAWQNKLKIFGYLFSAILFLGYASIPFSVLMQWLKPVTGGL